MAQRNRKTRKQKQKQQQQKQQQSKTCSLCKRRFKQSGGNYGLATEITVGGIPMRDDTVIVFPDGSSKTAKELKELEESL